MTFISSFFKKSLSILIFFLVFTLLFTNWADLCSFEVDTHSIGSVNRSSVTFTHTSGSTSRNNNESYIYHNYSSLVSVMKLLNQTYPDIFELYTAQAEFGLPDCQDGYKIWYVRITNENRGFNKPEILFIGGHHGNEPISIETPYYLMEYLVKNYETNSTIRSLIDTREIYIMPVINPWG